MTSESSHRYSTRLREKKDHLTCVLDVGKDHDDSTSESVPFTKTATIPIRHEYSFGGPIGVSLMLVALPLAVYYLNWLVMDSSRLSFAWPHHVFSDMWKTLQLQHWFDLHSTIIYLSWIALQVGLSLLPIGRIVQGQPLEHTGQRLSYRCNGIHAFILSAVLLIGLAVYQPALFIYIRQHWLAMISTAMITATLFSALLYVRSLTLPRHLLAEEGNSGCVPYDFFMGRELNPRLLGVDLKFVFELRPGLIGWAAMDFAFCVVELSEKASWRDCNPALFCLTLFHAIYVMDALIFEASILSTMDIIHEGLGFMLLFGNLVVVPFVYSLSAHYLLVHPVHWPVVGYVLLFALNILGFVIFRWANYEKDAFRRGQLKKKKNAKLNVIRTHQGKDLLVDGWWAVVRHPNYLGDIIMSLAWSGLCGFSHTLPWVYPIYFIPFLIGREFRDEIQCEKKYGSCWKEYQRRVPKRIFPWIF